ncbi:MAG: hypothetical protein U0172_08450 [Nitrospiraceae bacterium]
MTRQRMVHLCLGLGMLTLVGCGGSDNGPVSAGPQPGSGGAGDGFTAQVQAITASLRDDAEPVDVAGIQAVEADQAEPVAVPGS